MRPGPSLALSGSPPYSNCDLSSGPTRQELLLKARPGQLMAKPGLTGTCIPEEGNSPVASTGRQLLEQGWNI